MRMGFTYLLHIEGGFSRSFHEYKIIITCKTFSFFCWDLSSLVKVTFVSNKHDDHIRISILSDLFEPSGQVIECITSISRHDKRKLSFLPCDIIDKQSPGGTSIVWSSYAFETFLSSLKKDIDKELCHTVSQICNLMFLLLIWMVLAPNSTPIVRSCCYLNLLSVNWRSKHDLPTPNSKWVSDHQNSPIGIIIIWLKDQIKISLIE